jgi:hypothetical protein
MNKSINYKKKNNFLIKRLINLLILIRIQIVTNKILKILYKPQINKILIHIENQIYKIRLKI